MDWEYPVSVMVTGNRYASRSVRSGLSRGNWAPPPFGVCAPIRLHRGGDAKIIYLSDGLEQRTNNCAVVLACLSIRWRSCSNTDAQGLNELAKSHTTLSHRSPLWGVR